MIIRKDKSRFPHFSFKFSLPLSNVLQANSQSKTFPIQSLIETRCSMHCTQLLTAWHSGGRTQKPEQATNFQIPTKLSMSIPHIHMTPNRLLAAVFITTYDTRVIYSPTFSHFPFVLLNNNYIQWHNICILLSIYFSKA